MKKEQYSKHITLYTLIFIAFILFLGNTSRAYDIQNKLKAQKKRIKVNQYTDTEHNYKITTPKFWKHSFLLDGTDHIRAFLSPDKNIVLKIRSFTVDSNVTVELLRKVFEQKILIGVNLVDSKTGFVDNIPTSIGAYITVFNNITIGIGAVYFIHSGIAYIVWTTIPEYMLKLRSKDIDAIINTFKFIK